MSKAIIANNSPIKVTLEKDKDYYFCTCGRSKNQPFCDGSHATTDFSPLAFKAKENGDAYLCACKQSKNAPYCDGKHNQFSTDMVGKEAP